MQGLLNIPPHQDTASRQKIYNMINIMLTKRRPTYGGNRGPDTGRF